jgi:tRNA A37 threonylcarbamoyladenosine synthetase subunit TsaC/SUA5/YrdC
VKALRNGALIVFPTENGYLVGCSATDAEALRRLRQVTGASEDQLLRFAATPEQANRLTGPVRPLRHPVPLRLMEAADLPMAASTAPPERALWPTAQHAVFAVGDAVDLVLDAGRISPNGQAPASAAIGSSPRAAGR